MTEQKFDKDTWQTPKYCRNYLEIRFGWFDVDGAADSKNKLFPKWIGIGPAWGDNDNIALDFLGDDVIGKMNKCDSSACNINYLIGHVVNVVLIPLCRFVVIE